MLACLQRVTHASVTVEGEKIADIGPGLLVLLGLEPQDTETNGRKLIDKILRYRVFQDAEDRMNLSLKDTGGSLLLVSQFTLVAETSRGNRPGFETAMKPGPAQELFAKLLSYAKTQYQKVQSGRFGADMKVELLNDGPVTVLLKA